MNTNDSSPHLCHRLLVFVCLVHAVTAHGLNAQTVAPSEIAPSTTVTQTVTHADPVEHWANELDRYWRCFQNTNSYFHLSVEAHFEIDGNRQDCSISLLRRDDEYLVQAIHKQFAFVLIREDGQTTLGAPIHKTAFCGRGELTDDDTLQPTGLLRRLVSAQSSWKNHVQMAGHLDAKDALPLIVKLGLLPSPAQRSIWHLSDSLAIQSDASRLIIKDRDAEFTLNLEHDATAIDALWQKLSHQVSTWKTTELPRDVLERHLVRGIHRATEILAPGPALRQPPKQTRKANHGELRWQEHQRLVLLRGTPEQIGAAHGELLREESQRCLDSVYHTFGTVQSILSGKWFPHELEAAYQRLSPHIPDEHKRELNALADALGWDRQILAALNVFPELFHCSGFAVFNSATVDGKLYHGRVLDYMTVIGLQDAATVFVVVPHKGIPFLNVGYAGCIGSVTGMNAKQVSLGEMGGGGTGAWDGAPMATLMRRALQECSTVEEVMELWRSSPLTCEYYYVFADGKTNRAVGVAATPEMLEFVQPGQAHPRLGDGIEDTVVLSAGKRLQKLRERVASQHGNIDTETAQWLMSRPVATKSNLHNALFVPADGLAYIAQATSEQPAADTPYVKYDLNEILSSMHLAPPTHDTQVAKVEQRIERINQFQSEAVLKARDSLDLRIDQEESLDARQCLSSLAYHPSAFDVTYRTTDQGSPDAMVYFPSAISTGNKVNDRVSMEWYMAKSDEETAPAIIVVHESGRDMTAGRVIAKALRNYGLHAFLIHMPGYGERRQERFVHNLPTLMQAMRQAVTDIRRARDAVATLPLVDTNRIGLQGTSLGGFLAATAAGLDGGFDGVFIALAGGDLYALLQNGKQDTAKLRAQLTDAGVSDRQLHKLISLVEPNRLAHRTPPERTWLFSGWFDQVVPIENADALAKAANLDEDHYIRIPAGHYSSALFLPRILTLIDREIRR